VVGKGREEARGGEAAARRRVGEAEEREDQEKMRGRGLRERGEGEIEWSMHHRASEEN
jgi:hypothetical protein